jgi:hypothetical protein
MGEIAMQEIWRDLPGYEQYYQVSNFGKLRSKPRRVKCGNGYYTKPAKELKLQINNHGYLYFQVKADGEHKKLYIHRAVCMAFIPNINKKPYVNHMDSNPLNNNVSNLEWVTHKENVHHAMNAGRFKDSFSKTVEKFKGTIEEKQIPVIGTNIDTGEKIKFKSINEAGRHFNNRAGDICKCCKGERITAQGYKWEYA